MKIKLNNIVAFCLAIGALNLFLHHRHEALNFLSTAERIGPGNSTEDKTLGLLVIGICGVVLVAIVRLLVHNRRD